MPNILVVDDPDSWSLDMPRARVLSAEQYLTDGQVASLRRARVYNLCRSHGYQKSGYYVSLLAEARGHRPIPSATTMQDLRSEVLWRSVSEELGDVLDKSFADQTAGALTMRIYFGRVADARWARLGKAIFDRFPAPILAIDCAKKAEHWQIRRIGPLSAADIPHDELDLAVDAARRYFDRPRSPKGGSGEGRFELAILVDPSEPDAPSDAVALQRFQRAARALGMTPELITSEDFSRLAEFDALFIRATTSVNHYTYRFARRAEVEDIAVIDSPSAIVRCTNKVYLAELFGRHSIPAPKTLIVHGGNHAAVAETLRFPCVLKRPDSSFSAGVYKIRDASELERALDELLDRSALVVAQEWVPSEFDWRIGVLDGRPLYACRYYMARGHWQIQRAIDGGRRQYGKTETLPVTDAPPEAVELAVRAAELIGDGFYGVDIKEIDGRFLVIEVNDNPSVEDGVEDAVLKDQLYLAVMEAFTHRLARRVQHGTTIA